MLRSEREAPFALRELHREWSSISTLMIRITMTRSLYEDPSLLGGTMLGRNKVNESQSLDPVFQCVSRSEHERRMCGEGAKELHRHGSSQ